jgi:hypothetical protein
MEVPYFQKKKRKRILSSPLELERPPVHGGDGLRKNPKAIKLPRVISIKI